MEDQDWRYYRDVLQGQRLPLAFCDLDALEHNIAGVAGRAAGKPVRIASKSIRCRAVLERILGRTGFRGVMCYSAAEAAFLAESGLDDLLVAYPTVDPTDLGAALDQRALGKELVLTVDDTAQLAVIERMASERGVRASLCIDVDMSTSMPGLWFGVRRSPIRTPAAALELARAIDASPSLRLAGLLGYEAQIAGLADGVVGKAATNTAMRVLKSRSITELRRRRRLVVETLRDAGFALDFVNGGGTGSIESTVKDVTVTEIAVGSAFFAPHLFDAYRAFRHRPAAFFALPVTRQPAPDIVTCHGGGYVASGAASNDKLPQPYLPRGATLLTHEGAGEVQTPVRLPKPTRLAMGEPIIFRHAKAGELCERFASLLLVQGGAVVDEVPTYRGEGRCFL